MYLAMQKISANKTVRSETMKIWKTSTYNF